METNKAWRFCAVGNIIAQHPGEDGKVLYGTKKFSGGTKVYIDDRTWGLNDGKISVIGLNRFKHYEIDSVDVALIENVRLQRVFKPTVLKIMEHVEWMDGWKWRERTAQDKKEIKTFVEMWKKIVEGSEDHAKL